MTTSCSRIPFALVLVWGSFFGPTAMAEDASALAKSIRELSPNVLDGEHLEQSRQFVATELRTRLQQANDASRREWLNIKTAKQWEEFREQRLGALKRSLGDWPAPPKKIRTLVAGKVEGDGFVVENIAFESRTGWWVTANLYRPATPQRAMPGIIISHSHHRPKEHGELQDMGMTWARAGCYVLVPDHLGHGERGQHGFTSSDDFPREFRVSRQDYYFRYDNSIQLYLAGDSLMGWMAWDLMRGVDVLLAQDGIDKEKISLLGAVAGGGDPCAVTAALDERITCAAPFNFGGPQPETRYPLPEDAETWFNFAGSGSWESTRNLAFSAGEGSRFLPWEIVGSIAPRRLIFAHEFNWHRERDPVWKRLERIYQIEDATDHLAYTHGRGELKGRPPESTHCTHIGKFHRVKIHEAVQKWYGIEAEEYSERLDASDLRCGGAFEKEGVKNELLYNILHQQVAAALEMKREEQQGISAAKRRKLFRAALTRLLGDVEPPAKTVDSQNTKTTQAQVANDSEVDVIRFVVNTDRAIPCMLLKPKVDNERQPVVLGLAQGGKEAFLKHRSDEIAALLADGVAVCLPDVTNVGELARDNGRGRYSSATSRAASALMVGDPIVAQQLRDVRAILREIRSDRHVKSEAIALWGDSFSPLNSDETNLRVPRRIDGRPHNVEPAGGLLTLLTALYEEDIAAVFIHHGLYEFQGALQSPFVYTPLDSVVPGLLGEFDLPDLAGALAPLPMQLSAPVNANNRIITQQDARRLSWIVAGSYSDEGMSDKFTLTRESVSPSEWLIDNLRR